MNSPIQTENLVSNLIEVEGYKKVSVFYHEPTKLRAIIAIHNTNRGNALGGTRIHPYASFDLALTDVLRLAKGMTYKSAMAGVPFGGGKAVIIANPEQDKTSDLLLAYAEAINTLQGEFIASMDSGSTDADFHTISKRSTNIAGLASGNPSRFTAWGTYRGIQAVLQQMYGSDSVKGRKIVIQGVGAVGAWLTDFLFWQGADIVISDINANSVSEISKKYALKVVSPDEVYHQPCDVFSPCGFGGILNPDTIPNLRCKAIAGAANNQLLNDRDSDILMQKGILYAPDFVINAGGVINVAEELAVGGYNPKASQQKCNNIYNMLLDIFKSAEDNNISTTEQAVQMAEGLICG
jgi:leucine dehydrogenase